MNSPTALYPIHIVVMVVGIVSGTADAAFAQGFLPPTGGGGGGQFVATCPAGQNLTGLELRAGLDIDAVRPVCVVAYGPDEITAPVLTSGSGLVPDPLRTRLQQGGARVDTRARWWDCAGVVPRNQSDRDPNGRGGRRRQNHGGEQHSSVLWPGCGDANAGRESVPRSSTRGTISCWLANSLAVRPACRVMRNTDRSGVRIVRSPLVCTAVPASISMPSG